MHKQDYIRIVVRPGLANLEIRQLRVANGLNLSRLHAKDKNLNWVLYAWLLGYPDFIIEDGKIKGTCRLAEEFLNSFNGELRISNNSDYVLDE